MAVEITKLRQESIGFVAEERLWLASDGKTIVRDGDYRAAQLLVAKGGVIPDKLAKKLALSKGVTVADLQMKAPEAISNEDIQARSTRPERVPEKR